ncbi:MAG: competence/damage-inducible protein A [Terrimicrobiaceae bacterium]
MPNEPLRIEILNTGTELLLGEVINTNLAKMATRLFPLGLRIDRQTTVPDGAAIRSALAEALDRCDILFVTGGLGPTTDDITRETTAELLGLALTEDPSITAAIGERLARRGFAFKERMRRQAMVPRGATVIPNPNGTAPGLYIPPQITAWRCTPHIFLLPGPPRELLPMLDDEIIPRLRDLAGGIPAQSMRVYHIVGMGESWVEEAIGLELSRRGDIEVGYCARPNEVDLRLVAPESLLDEVEPLVLRAVGNRLVSKAGENLESWVVGELTRRKLTLTTAESCTGGLLAHRITNVPGASLVFREGSVTYSNEAKSRLLGVSANLISAHGAVSEPVAIAMAEGALSLASADFALSLTGIAGPEGGSSEKPVGTVYIGLAARGQPTIAIKACHPTDRETFKTLATQSALDTLRLRLLNTASPTS